eukprot:TRINITY_DN2500_c0_g1_i1.p1 TRINITY_DN2500_c0_g1~~TRINITY_DN2500_c0_g1_i1.p1  ORF type:complete len:215 (-),score=61.70 TRINITY_DN2500_c0_g1_i1:59-661(-)
MNKVALVFLSLFIAQSLALTFRVEPNREECFYEDVTAGTKVSGTYQVAQGGLLDIDVRVWSPEESMIYAADRRHDGEFSFTAVTPGTYRFCFGNHMSKMTPKLVQFHLHNDDDHTKGGFAKDSDLTPLEQSVINLRDELRAITEEQQYMKARERRHRNTTESTNARVLWYSFLEAIVLVCVSLWQIFYLRRMFEKRRTSV